MKRAVGFCWFIIWLASGTYLSVWLELRHLRFMEVFLPVLLIGWCILLFVGHNLIDRIFKKFS